MKDIQNLSKLFYVLKFSLIQQCMLLWQNYFIFIFMYFIIKFNNFYYLNWIQNDLIILEKTFVQSLTLYMPA